MKKIIVIVLIAFFVTNSSAQNLTIDQLIQIRTKSISQIEEFLTSKNWEITTNTSSNWSLSFSYLKQLDNDKAQAFIMFKENENKNLNEIAILLSQVTKYNTYINRVKELGFKLINSETNNGELTKLYKKGDTYIQINTGTIEIDNVFKASKAIYKFLIYFTPTEVINEVEEEYEKENNNIETEKEETIEWYRSLIEKSIEIGNYKDGLTLAEAIESRISPTWNDTYNKGICYYGIDDFQKAIDEFKKIESKYKNDYTFNSYFASALLFNKSFTESIKYYSRLINSKKVTKEDYSNIAFCYLCINQFDQSLFYYKKALSENKIISHIDYLTILSLSGKKDLALNQYNKILSSKSEDKKSIDELIKNKIKSLDDFGINHNLLDNLLKIIPKF